ncbi:ATP-dependent RNA helicase Ddx1 [Halotydeus destructor]|nr:ATP-dependent RNA helicase Ddx1 [Halotydeus destructor]
MPDLAKSVDDMEWMLPTDIQQEAIPLILGGGDVLMAAETGSGKTGAFCLPVLQIVWETMNDTHKSRITIPQDGWLLSVNDRSDNLVLANDRLHCQSKGNFWQGVRASRGFVRDNNRTENKFYYEAHFTEKGLARVGWSLSNASLDLGTDRNGWGFGGTAKKSNSKNFTEYGVTFGEKDDIIGCAIDLDSREMSFFKNGTWLGIAFSLPRLDQPIFPSICTKNAPLTLQFSSNSQSAPSGHVWAADALSSQFVANPMDSSVPTQQSGPNKAPKAIILEPSRELAEQTFNCLRSFKSHLAGEEVKILLIVGGANAKDQVQQLEIGVDIIVATPGRLMDLVDNGYVQMNGCLFFVMDEVDGLLQQGHKELICKLHRQIPRMYSDGKRLQMIVCSATLHNFDVKRLAQDLMYFPTWVDLKGEDSVPETVHHVVVRVDPRKDLSWKESKRHIQTDAVHQKDKMNTNQPTPETLSEAVKLLKGELVIQVIRKFNMDQGIIFCRTKVDCDNLEQYMNLIGGGQNIVHPYTCVCLHADRRPQERTANLEKFKTGNCNFLICTDVAARGLDIKGIPYVIQVTLPDEKANYVHRIGRVGRAERMGLAVSLVSYVPEKVWYHSNCKTRGKGCFNTDLTDRRGCCIWYNELELLSDIEENLKCTIQQLDEKLDLEVNEFDGKVTYGSKRSSQSGFTYENHVQQLSSVVSKLCELESKVQINYLQFYALKKPFSESAI